jgi:hypothetical protein
MKTPPKQIKDDQAHALTEEFIRGSADPASEE